jgi:hypothetical protein
LFENNDLPGIYTSFAANLVLAHGVMLGDHWVLVGEGTLNLHLASVLAKQNVNVTSVAAEHLLAAEGNSRVSSVRVQRENRVETIACDVLVLDEGYLPSFSLTVAPGASLAPQANGGFVPIYDEQGEACPQLFVTGQARGLPLVIEQLAADGIRIAKSVIASMT